MEKRISFNNKILFVGFGSIGSAVLPLILKHINIAQSQIKIIAADICNIDIAQENNIEFECIELNKNNYIDILQKNLQSNDVLLNLSVNISSLDLITFCSKANVLYMDTSIERWYDIKHTAENLYERRSNLLSRRQEFKNGPSALICHGANPGIVSHLAKYALLDIIGDIKGEKCNTPTSQQEWAKLFYEAQIVAIHISECDTQVSSKVKKSDEFVNTWSVPGFLDEALENCNFSWGTHEEELPKELVHNVYNNENYRSIELNLRGGDVKLKSWIPHFGVFNGFVIPHAEAFSLAEYFSYKINNEMHHPTVHYVYQPSNDAIVSLHNALAQNITNPVNKRILVHENVIEGFDSLGVLFLIKNSSKVYWFGSTVEINEAKELAQNNNATSIQVAAGVLSGLIYIINNPKLGLIEAEELDSEQIIEIAKPYLGELKGYWGEWNHNNTWTFKSLAVNIK